MELFGTLSETENMRGAIRSLRLRCDRTRWQETWDYENRASTSPRCRQLASKKKLKLIIIFFMELVRFENNFLLARIATKSTKPIMNPRKI